MQSVTSKFLRFIDCVNVIKASVVQYKLPANQNPSEITYVVTTLFYRLACSPQTAWKWLAFSSSASGRIVPVPLELHKTFPIPIGPE